MMMKTRVTRSNKIPNIPTAENETMEEREHVFEDTGNERSQPVSEENVIDDQRAREPEKESTENYENSPSVSTEKHSKVDKNPTTNTTPVNQVNFEALQSQFFAFMSSMMNGAQNFMATPLDEESKKWMAADKAYHTPPFTLCSIPESDKLHGHRNFQLWVKMIELDLGALNLLPFIRSENGVEINISPARRNVLNVQALQYIKTGVTKNISNSLENVTSAFGTFLRKCTNRRRCMR